MNSISTPRGSKRLAPNLELRVTVGYFDEHAVVHLRYFRKCGRKWLPTQKGISLRPDVLPWLADLLTRL